MKGCLSLIVKLVILILVFFGLLHLGVIDFIKDKINENKSTSQEEILDKTKDVVDLSQIDDEYSVERNMKFLKNRMIVAEHKASGQKMIIIEPKDETILTKQDIQDDKLQEKINNFLTNAKYQIIKFDRLEVTKRSEFEGFGQKIPFAKVEVEISNLPFKDMEGIIGVAQSKDGKNLIVISANKKGKYSQIITEAFYKKVK